MPEVRGRGGKALTARRPSGNGRAPRRAAANAAGTGRAVGATARRAWSPPSAVKFRVLFLDVDGTLTDGRIEFSAHGDSRQFWIRDGLALEWARDLGVLPVAISGRDSRAVAERFKELGVEHYLGIKDKVAVAEGVLAREGATWKECVMVGDDLPDVPLMRRVGWPIAVGDAHPLAKRFARTVVAALAGQGAVREVVERVLKHNGTWTQVLDRYEAR